MMKSIRKTPLASFALWRNICLAMALATSFLIGPSLLALDDDGKLQKQTEVKVDSFYRPDYPERGSTQVLMDLMKKDPKLSIKRWGGISLPQGGKAPLMMSIAGKTAPDVGLSWFHTIRTEIKQGFLYPLDEWIGKDKNGNGVIDDDESVWKDWKKIRPLWRQVASIDGKIYGVPRPTINMQGIIYRIDLVEAAGLDPYNPPKTWDEFIYWCQCLTNPNIKIEGAVRNQGQSGFLYPSAAWRWLPWIQSQGANPIMQVRKSPKTGENFEFAPEATSFITPDGEDLGKVKPIYKATFANPAGIKAMELLHKLCWMKWLRDPKTGKPVNLSETDLANGFVEFKGKKIEFTEEDVLTGMTRTGSSTPGESETSLISSGEVAMFLASVDDLTAQNAKLGIDPDLLSWFPYPAGPGPDGQRVVQIQHHYIVMYEGVGDRPKAERDQVWEVVKTLFDEKARDLTLKQRILTGMSRFVNPADLKRLGYEEYIRDIPKQIAQNFKEIDNGTIKVYTEPFMGFWLAMDLALKNEVISCVSSTSGEHFDYDSALKEVQRKANSGVMFETPKEILDAYRPWARVAFGAILVIFIVFLVLIIRAQLAKKGKMKARSMNVSRPWLPWLIVGPALILIGLWRYYPLLRGMFMAFQDYKIAGESKFVGLDNFIILFRDLSFWKSIARTFLFVFLNMSLAFTAPIILALLLTETPRFKIFFRTLFFLPQMTSGLIIALMWKLMYNKSPEGFFNQIISYINAIPFVEISHQDWLGDPNLAMLCCVIPTVWASMGMASLIYLAALHSIPTELYEAADVDGAGIFSKIRHITLPSIMPLIVINFVGAFIGTFQNMGNIFLMTFGGPGEATTVVGLKIWIEAYNNLRFSMATSMAWVLGAMLIGFTYMQIRFLNKVEFRKAQEN